jgi:hypothetical protein
MKETTADGSPSTPKFPIDWKKREPAFVQLYRSILRHPDLSATAKAVYAIVKGYADSKGVCWPPRWRIGANLGTKSLRTVDAALEELKTFGVLFWIKGDSTKANEYHFTDKQCHYRLKREEVQNLRYSQVPNLLPKYIQLPRTLEEPTPDNVVKLPKAKPVTYQKPKKAKP